MKLEIIGWRAHNLRGYLREFEVELDPTKDRWTLMQMPNGTGKTTTMSLLRIAFEGRPPPAEQILGYRADESVAEGLFELRLRIDQAPYIVRLNFDFRTPRVFFQTTTSAQESGGIRDGHHLPSALKDTMRNGGARIFVFDGELASDIIQEGGKSADILIRVLYNLDAFAELQSEVEKELDKKKRSARNTQASTRNSIDRLQEAFDEILDVRARLEANERRLKLEIGKHEDELKNIDSELALLAQNEEEFSEEQSAIDLEVNQLAEKSDRASGDALRRFRSPPQIHPFIKERLSGLGGTMDHYKLPRSMSREFFEQLARSKVCVCGRPILEHERTEILDHMEDYLGQDEIAVINTMKTRLHSLADLDGSFSDAIIELSQHLAQKQTAEQRLARLRRRMEEAGLERAAALRTQEAETRQKLILAQDGLARLLKSASATGDWRSNLAACREEYRQRERRLSEATGTLSFRMKAQRLEAIIREAEHRSTTKLREVIRTKTNELLDGILVNEPLQVEAIEGHLKVVGEASIKKDAVSEGQKLAVAYAFLSALLSQEHHQLPFIVDSPAVPLDVQLRRTVGNLIPPLFEQMLMFVISSEREGFAESFEKREGARFITVSLDTVTGRTSVEDGWDAFQSFHARGATQ